MNENKKKMYDLSGPKTVEAMKKRHFDAYYCSTAAEAVEKALELIPKTDSVSWGGVMTVDELGLKQRLAQEGYTLIDRDTAKDPAEKQALMHQALSCGTFLMSSNAISKDGQLVNIDGMGNRVAAMCYGPRQVVVIAGMNKVLGTLDDAIARARNIAAPANAQRFGIKTPCGLTGQCGDCTSPDCICSYVVVTRNSMVHERIKVILVGEDLGLQKEEFCRCGGIKEQKKRGSGDGDHHIPSGNGQKRHRGGGGDPSPGRPAGYPHGDGIRTGGRRAQRGRGAPYFRG